MWIKVIFKVILFNFKKCAVKKISMCISFVVLLIKGVIYSLLTIGGGRRTLFYKKTKNEVLVCGNGPSLREIDLEKACKSGVDIAVVNFFPVFNSLFFKIKPKYIFLLDDIFFVSKEYEIKNDSLGDNIKKMWSVLENVSWDMIVVTNQRYNVNIRNKHISVEKISNYSLRSDVMVSLVDFLYKRNLVIVGGRNVIIGALYYFINCAAKTIYLSGVDMSEFKQLTVDANNDVFVNTVHDYGIERRKVNVKSGGLYISLGWYQKMFEQFYYVAQYAKRRNVPIYNLSMNSYLDVFEKIEKKSWKRCGENE